MKEINVSFGFVLNFNINESPKNAWERKSR